MCNRSFLRSNPWFNFIMLHSRSLAIEVIRKEEKHAILTIQIDINNIKSTNAKSIKECWANIEQAKKESKDIYTKISKLSFVISFFTQWIITSIKISRVVTVKPILLCFEKREAKQSQVLKCQVKAQYLNQELFNLKHMTIKSTIVDGMVDIVKSCIGHRNVPISICNDGKDRSVTQFPESSFPKHIGWKNFFKILRGHDHVTYSI